MLSRARTASVLNATSPNLSDILETIPLAPEESLNSTDTIASAIHDDDFEITSDIDDQYDDTAFEIGTSTYVMRYDQHLVETRLFCFQ